MVFVSIITAGGQHHYHNDYHTIVIMLVMVNSMDAIARRQWKEAVISLQKLYTTTSSVLLHTSPTTSSIQQDS